MWPPLPSSVKPLLCPLSIKRRVSPAKTLRQQEGEAVCMEEVCGYSWDTTIEHSSITELEVSDWENTLLEAQK